MIRFNFNCWIQIRIRELCLHTQIPSVCVCDICEYEVHKFQFYCYFEIQLFSKSTVFLLPSEFDVFERNKRRRKKKKKTNVHFIAVVNWGPQGETKRKKRINLFTTSWTLIINHTHTECLNVECWYWLIAHLKKNETGEKSKYSFRTSKCQSDEPPETGETYLEFLHSIQLLFFFSFGFFSLSIVILILKYKPNLDPSSTICQRALQ